MAVARRPPHLLPGQNVALRSQILLDSPLELWRADIARRGIFTAEKLAALAIVLGIIFSQVSFVVGPAEAAPDEITGNIFEDIAGDGLNDGTVGDASNPGLAGVPVSIFRDEAAVQTADSPGEVGQYSSIAIGSDGNPVVAYGDMSNGDLKVLHCDDPSCATYTTTTVESAGSVGQSVSLAIGADGFPVISHYDYGNLDLRVYKCSNVACTAGSGTAVDTVGSQGSGSSIAIGTDGLPIISYFDGTAYDLKVAHCNDTACATSTITAIDTASTTGVASSIAIGGDGLAVVSYRLVPSADLKVAHCDNVACTSGTSTVVDTTGDLAGSSSIAQGSDGFPAVAYFDLTNRDLKFAHCLNATCSVHTITTVDGPDDVGYNPSVAIGLDGNPIIAHWDFSNTALKLTYCDDLDCSSSSSSTPDSAGNVGSDPSMVLTAGGSPVVAYQDQGNYDLKILTAANGVPDAGDTFVSTTTTDVNGAYSFSGLSVGEYLVAVESTAVAATAGYDTAQTDSWAEQTYGPSGSLCANGSGGTLTRSTAGACYGGSDATTSDSFDSGSPDVTRAEHVASVAAGAASANFGFSFNAVTNSLAGDTRDDDVGAGRTVQGSLRQFIQNANAITGANDMRFVPAEPTNATDGTNNWWRVSVTDGLPAIDAPQATVDGIAYDSADGTTVVNPNPTVLGTVGTVGADDLALPQVAGPELELLGDLTVGTGLSVSDKGDNSSVRGLAISQFQFDGLAVGGALADKLVGVLVEENVLGSGPSAFADPGAGSRQARSLQAYHTESSGTIRNNLIGFGDSYSVLMTFSARDLTFEGNEIGGASAVGVSISFSGAEVSGGITLRGNLIKDTWASAVSMYGSYGSNTLENNTFTNSATNSAVNVYGSGNSITKNVITGNGGAAIAVVGERPITSPTWAASTDNLISQNIFGNNGGLAIDLVESTDSEGVHYAGDGITLTPGTLATTGNNGVDAPVMTTATTTMVSGTSCANCDVEVYKAIAGAGDGVYGEGVEYVGTATADGSEAWTLSGITTLTTSDKVTAIAIDVSNDTSEFGANSTVAEAPPTVPMAVWRNSGGSNPLYAGWNGSSFTGPQPSQPVGEFKIIQGAESPSRDEAIVVGVTEGGTIAGELWDGSSWSSLPALGSTTQSYWWGFDVAYEPVSGDAVVVYADGANLNYRVWNGAVWSGENPIPEPPGGTPRQMQLAAHPYSDEMVLIVSNDSSQDYAVVWDGSAWGNGLTLDSTGTGNDRTDVYVAYEQKSGRALVVWGSGNDDVHFRIWDGGWSNEFVTPGVGGLYARWITLGADPNSNNVAMGVITNDQYVWLSVWNGAGWVNQTTATTGTTGTTEPSVAVGFEGISGQAIATYGENVVTPRYRTWTSGSGWSGEGSLPSIGAVSNSTVLYPEPGTDAAMLAVNDDSFGIHYLYWNGSTWGMDNELETSSGDTKNQPFLFLWEGAAAVSPSLVVNSTNDDSDSSPGDGMCGTGNLNSQSDAECTLRAAIEEANALAGNNAIGFDIPTSETGYSASPLSYTIQVGVPSGTILPAITGPVTIDGSTQPDFPGTPIIVLDGTAASASDPNGLTLEAGSSTIRGLVIVDFNDDAIELDIAGSNTIVGNYLGVDADGTTASWNGWGLSVKTPGNTIGGTTATDRNVISGNANYGIGIYDAASGNVVQGNYIGVAADGSTARGNGARGIEIKGGANNNTIGGTTAGAGNIISGNIDDGIFLQDVGTDDNIIRGNYIGTDITGLVDLGNTDRGVQIESGADSNTVGGTTVAARNVISGNGGDGVVIGDGVSPGTGTTGNVVAGNYIGVGADGTTALGNDEHGVHITTVDGNTIGGGAVEAGNVIANNNWVGVIIQNSAATANTILRNSIYSNGGIGIDLGGSGVTENDGGDGDPGANDLLNFPVITEASEVSGTVTVDFGLDVPNGSYRVEFFTNTAADGTGNGEGETWVSAVDVSVTGGVSTPASHTFAGFTDDILTATATEGIALPFGSTSEFSAAFTVTTNLPPVATNDPPAGSYQVTEGGSVQWDVMGNDSDPNGDTLRLSSFTQPSIGTVTRFTNGTPADTSDDYLRYTAPVGPVGPTTFTYTISDGFLTDTATVFINVNAANNAPVFDQDLGDQIGAEASWISLTAAATDPDVGDTLTYSTTGLPLGLSIDSGTGLITGMVNYYAAASSPYSVEITVDDGNGGTDTDTFTWTVTNVPTMPPYVVAGSGGANGGNDLLTRVNPVDVDPVTNEVDIGIGTGTNLTEAIAIQPSTGVLFAVDGGQLGTLDLDSGVFAPVGTGLGSADGNDGTVTLDNVVGLTFHPLFGRLFGVHTRAGDTDLLFAIDTTTGAVVPNYWFGGRDYVEIRALGALNDVTDIAIDPTSWQMYGVMNDGTPTGPVELVTIRRWNGRTRSVDPLARHLTGLSYNTAGQLWGVDEGAMYSVDKTDGSLGTPRPLDNGTLYGAIDFGIAPATPPALEGTVFEDIDGNLLAGTEVLEDVDNPGIGGVTVYLYSDDGSVPGEPDALDSFHGSTLTGPTGHFFFTEFPAGGQWIVVDSSTIAPTAGGSGWPEQTYGPVGAVSYNGSTYSVAGTAGALYGGMQPTVSDDPSALLTSEHVAYHSFAPTEVLEEVDFGFSFNVVTNLEGGGASSPQGSLRQFMANANTMTGPNSMRFVPAVGTNGTNGTDDWWSLAVTAALPQLTDADTTIDGTAYSSADGATVLDTNTAQVGAGQTVGTDAATTTVRLDPELAIYNDRTTPVANGLDVQSDNAVLRNFAIHGFGTGGIDADLRIGDNGGGPVVDGVTVENVVVGTDPASNTNSGPDITPYVGVLIARSTNGVFRDSLVRAIDGYGFRIGLISTGWSITGNEFSGNGTNGSSSAFLLTTSGATISGNLLAANTADALIISADGQGTIDNNTIDLNGGHGVYVFSNALASTFSNNIITNNGGGIAMLDPVNQNRLSQNTFGGNGGISIDLGGAAADGVTANSGVPPACGYDVGVLGNDGIDAPVISSAAFNAGTTTITGTACAGAEVEIYRAVADSDASDTSGGTDYGEGVEYLSTVSADGITGAFSLVSVTLAEGEFVSAIAIDGSNNTSEFGANAVVGAANNPPTAVAGGPYTIAEGEDLVLDGSGSSDPDTDPLTYLWDVDNDGQYDDTTGPNPTVSWLTLVGLGIDDDGGPLTIGLQVDDSVSGTDSDTAQLTITNTAPDIIVTGTGNAVADTSYSVTVSVDEPGDDTVTDWTVSWGDGTHTSTTGPLGAVAHTYSAAGRYDVTVSVVDEDGYWSDADLFVPSWETARHLGRYDGSTGAFEAELAAATTVDTLGEVEIGPDGLLYVSSYINGRIARFDPSDNSFVDFFVTTGITGPLGIEFGPDGNLYVSDWDNSRVRRYNGTTRADMGTFATGSELNRPSGLTFGPDGNLYVASNFGVNAVVRYDGSTGAFIDVFTTVGGTSEPEDLEFGPDGNLYVAYSLADQIGRFDGLTGAFIDSFVPAGSGLLDEASGIEWGPDGNLYVSSRNTHEIKRYDGDDGTYLGNFVAASSGGLTGPLYATFLPDHLVRCDPAPDTTPPVITLVGADPQVIEVGSAYTELGGTALDDVDGDITGSIVINSSGVNTAVLGSYSVTYDVSDAAGNPAVQVTRTVDVVDTTAPLITLLGANPQIIEVGTAYSELGATAVDNYDGIISGSIVINASAVNTAVVGSYSVTYNVTDANGNPAVQVTRTVDVVDTTAPVITLLGANPQTVEVGAAYSELGATAVDNYDGIISGSIVINASAVNTAVVGSYSVTYNVTDANGNPAVQVTRTVNVVDTGVPVVTLLGTNPVTVEVGSLYVDAGATAWDTGDGDLTGSIVTVNPVNNLVLGSYLVTYDVTDSQGNPAVQVTRTVDVVDTTVPVITLLGANPQTIEVGTAYSELGATAVDNYDGIISGSIVINSSAVNTAVVGSYSVTYDVTDANGNDAVQAVRTVDVVDTTLPVITLLGANPQVIEVGDAYSELGATASDNYDGDISGSIVIDAGSVNTSVVASYSVTYNVTDANGNAAAQVIRTVDVVDTTVPVITLLGTNPQVIEVGTAYSELGATASDNYDGDITGSIIINSSAVNTAVVGSYVVTYDVVDSSGNPTNGFRTVDVVDTTAPVITLLGSNPQTIEVGAAYTELGATAFDNYDGDITGSIVISSAAVNTAVIGSYSVTYDVTDSEGNPATQVIRTVDVVDSVAPIITLLGANPQIIEVGTAYSELGATAFDVGDGDITGSIVINSSAVNTAVVGSYSVTYDVTDSESNPAIQVVRTVDVVDTTLPVITLLGANPQVIEIGAVYSELGATASDNYDGDISGSIVINSSAVNTAVVGAYSVTCNVTDSAGNAAVQVTRTVDVVDTTLPVIALLGADPQVIEVGIAYSELGATASDNYDGDISGSILIDSSAVNPAVVGSYSVTYDVTDANGNAATQVVRTVDVVDTTVPVITLLGVDPQVIEIDTAYSELGATASDAYDGDISGSIVINAVAVNTGVVGSYPVTYDVTDANGNAAVQVFRTVDVVDTTVPVITLLGANPQTIEVGTAYSELGATAFDNYDGDISGSIVIDSAAVNSAMVGSYSVTYDATDSEGNAAAQVVRTVDVVDTTVPVITLLGASPQTIEVGTAYSELGATASDNYDGDITGSIIINSSAVNTAVVGSYSVTYDATDSEGNAAAQVVRTVDVVDTTAPVITLLGANPQVIEVGTGYSELGATASDNYDGDITGLIVINSSAVNTAVIGSYSVTYDVTDSEGNAAAQVTRTVDVVDTAVPVITLLGANPQTIEVGTAYAELGATAFDIGDGDITGSIVVDSAAVNTAVVGSYTVTYDVTDSQGNDAVQVSRTVDVVDTTVPSITLLGADPQTIEVGTAYSELGATATDNYDGDISGSIVINSAAVNTAVVGSYLVTYDVTDSEGNAAVQVTRTVDVVDTTVPVITLLGANPQTIEVGTAYSELGATATDNYDGDISGSIVINSAAVNTAVVGTYAVTYDVTDSGGNAAIQVTRTVDVVDTTVPVITLLGANPQVIEVGTAYSELGATASDNYDGDISGSIVTNSAAVNTAVVGTYVVTYDVVDSSGNPASAFRTVDVVDTTPPVITLLGANPQIIEVGAAYGELGATAVDNYDGDLSGSIIVNSASVNTGVVGSYSVTYDVTDSEGNAAVQVTRTVDVVDTTAPIITLLGADPQSIAVTSPYVELGATATDNYDGDISGSIVIDSSAVNIWVVGSYPVTYDVVDSEGNPAAQVIRTVNVTNVAPTLGAVVDQTVDEGIAAAFTATASDPDPTDPLTFSLSGAPAGASIDPVSGAFTWTPSEAQGPNVFVFDVVVTDGGAPALTDSQTVTFTVTEVNAAPSIAAIGPQVVDEQAMLTFGVLASDSDLPTNGLAYSLAGSPAGAGIDGAGVFSWTPSEAQGPGVYTFDVVVADDGSPALGAIQPVTVTVGEVNASPTVVNPGPQTVAEADVVSVFISAADSDVPVNSLTYAATGLPDGLSIDAFTGEIAGAVGYTANVASPFSTTVTVFDDGTPIRSTQVAFTWTVADTNRDPVAANDVAVVDEDTPQLLGVLANDSDPDADPVTVSSVGLPAHGSAAIGAGGITYAPDPNYFGPDSFIYTISDGRGGSDSATIDITVTAVNDAPVLSVPGSLGVDEGTAARFTAAATDTENDTVVFSLVGAPAGSAIDPSTGAFNWVPTEAQGPGSFSFDVVATDGGVPALASSRRVRIDVAEVNTAPLITNPGNQVSSENSTVSLAIAASDSDLPANSLTYAATGLPGGLSIDPATGVISGLLPYDAAAGSPYSVVVTARDNGAPSRSSQTRFSWSIVNTNRPPSAMDITVFAEAGLPTSLVLNGADPDGDVLSFSIAAAPTQGALTGGPRLYDYTPDVAAAGSDGFTFTVSDGQYQATGTVTVSITPNHPPIGGGDQYVVRRGGVVVVDAPGVLGNDSDPENQPITAALERRPAYGTADVQPDGRVVYSHLGGDGDLDRFTYVIHDGMRTSVPITVLIIIEENTAPVVVDDFLHLNEDASLVFHPLANDSDPNGEAILVADVLAPLNGSIDWSLDGAFIYRPNRDWNGVETITYRVTDGELSSVGVITLTVHPVNDPPSATGVDLVGDSGETLLIDLRPYVHDVDDDELGFILESPPIGSVAEVEPGVFELNLDGVVRDMAPLTFVVFDPHDEKATALVSITVKIPAELVGVPSLVSDDITGPPQSSGDPVQTDPLPGAPLVTGLRLMIGSVLDTFQALRIPFGILVLFVIASLFLGLSRKFAFSSAATILPLSGRKRVDIVMAQSHAGVPARTEPGTHQSVVHRFDPDETGIITTGARMMVRSEVWVEVETPEGDAWVDAEFITEQQSRAIFVDDLRPRELVSDLIERFYHNEDLLAVTGGHDLHVALYGPPVRFAASSLRRLLSGASVYWWWGPEGDTPRHQGTFAETVGESVAIAYRNQDSHPVDASLPIPVEFVNMHSLVVGNHELGEGWRVFFRYENDEPAIAALMREVAPNPASMHGEMALR